MACLNGAVLFCNLRAYCSADSAEPRWIRPSIGLEDSGQVPPASRAAGPRGPDESGHPECVDTLLLRPGCWDSELKNDWPIPNWNSKTTGQSRKKFARDELLSILVVPYHVRPGYDYIVAGGKRHKGPSGTGITRTWELFLPPPRPLSVCWRVDA